MSRTAALVAVLLTAAPAWWVELIVAAFLAACAIYVGTRPDQ